MFKFLKDFVSSIKESAAEGVAEFHSEEAIRKNQKIAALQLRNAPLLARLSNASAFESFAVALAAPYRQTFCRDLYEARKDGRPAVYLLCSDIPPDEVTTWKSLLIRDFSVSDAESAQKQFSSMIEILDKFADDDALALWIVRTSHLAIGSASVGYVSTADALAWLAPVVTAAVDNFSGWEVYGNAFLRGESKLQSSNFAGSLLLANTVKSLLADDLSPWKTLHWSAPSMIRV